jgi:hypothetical protein
MAKNPVRWQMLRCRWYTKDDVLVDTAGLLDIYYRGELLAHILAMPKKASISLQGAADLLNEIQKPQFHAANFGSAPGQYNWYAENFVEWISSLGYHIELTGDEFEATVAQEHVA